MLYVSITHVYNLHFYSMIGKSYFFKVSLTIEVIYPLHIYNYLIYWIDNSFELQLQLEVLYWENCVLYIVCTLEEKETVSTWTLWPPPQPDPINSSLSTFLNRLPDVHSSLISFLTRAESKTSNLKPLLSCYADKDEAQAWSASFCWSWIATAQLLEEAASFEAPSPPTTTDLSDNSKLFYNFEQYFGVQNSKWSVIRF